MNHLINNVMNFTSKAVNTKNVLDVKDMTTGEILVEGLFYTAVGMGITFIVLIAISILIGMFKYIKVLETFIANKKAAKAKNKAAKNKAANTNVQVTAQPVVEEVLTVEELTNDLELVAVIAAAIAASLNTTTDNLHVRSIRKVKA